MNFPDSTYLFVLAVLIPSFTLTWLGCFVLRHYASRWGLVDQPGYRKIHDTPKPTSAGIAIAVGVLLPLLVGVCGAKIIIFLQQNSPHFPLLQMLPDMVKIHANGVLSQLPKLCELVGGGIVLLLLGLADDLRGLDWRLRIGVETSVAFVMVLLGWRLALPLPFQTLPTPLFCVIQWGCSIFWIVGLINSFNMLDNMDGLSGGVAAIASAMLAMVLLGGSAITGNEPQFFVAGMFLLLAGALCGFLRHNRFPAKIFMGDTGAYFVGYLIAMLTISATFAGENLPNHTIFAPLCVLAVPIYDTLSVVVIRIRSGKSPFEGDKNHYSHRLVRLGMSRIHAVRTIYLTTFCCGLGAMLLYEISFFGAIIVLTMIVSMLSLIANIEFSAAKTRETPPHEP